MADDKLVPMELTKAEIKDRNQAFSVGPSPSMKKEPQFPWGLSLDLNEMSLDKLGLATPKVGAYVMVTARCCVTNTNESKRAGADGSEECRSITLQVEDMSVQMDKPARGTAKRVDAPTAAASPKHTAQKRTGAK